MKLGIVGNGVVGRATVEALAFVPCRECRGTGMYSFGPSASPIVCQRCQGRKRVPSEYEVFVYDADPTRSCDPLREVLRCDLVFVCLPTPQKQGSLACDTSILDEFFSLHLGDAEEESEARKRRYVVRSTVPIGYIEEARRKHCIRRIVHWPDFHTERLSDACNPTHLAVGGECPPLVNLLRERWPGVPLFQLTPAGSAACKLMQNSFGAVQIALLNEFRVGALQHDVDWSTLLEALIAGGWLGPMHTRVPGPDGKYGFGGACLPKDIANLASCLADSRVLRAALERNHGDRLQ